MNLHAIVRGAITTVNPDILATLHRSTGWTQNADFTRSPTYDLVPSVLIQVQGLNAKDLEHMDALNIQGVLRSVHLNGNWQGVIRVLGAGGDLFEFGGQKWLVVHVMETWPDWSRVIVMLQNGN